MFNKEDKVDNENKVLNSFSNASEPMVESQPETVDSPDEADNEVSNVEF